MTVTRAGAAAPAGTVTTAVTAVTGTVVATATVAATPIVVAIRSGAATRHDAANAARPASNAVRPRRDGEATEDRRRQRPHFTPPPEVPQRPKPKRLRPGKQHLEEVLAALPEEQRPVAELALQGLPAVRQRIREDNARLAAEDRPTMPEATVLKMAEELIPRLRVAEWLDRAEAAKRQLAHLDLRDLRSVVVASDDPVVVRDEATRELAAELKAALVTKQEEELQLWLADVESAAEVGRVVRALKLSALPPKAGVPFPAALGTKLGELTNAALTPDDPADRWIAVLEAAAFSPVRTHVQPSGVPAVVSDDLRATVVRLAPLLPQVAALFGVEVPAKASMPKPFRVQPRKKEAARPRQNVASHPGPARRADRPKPPRRARRTAAVEPETSAAEPETSAVGDRDGGRARPRRRPWSPRRRREPWSPRRRPWSPRRRPWSPRRRPRRSTRMRSWHRPMRPPRRRPRPSRSPPRRTPTRRLDDEVEPVAAADTVTPAAAGSEADATAGLAADDAELPTFAE